MYIGDNLAEWQQNIIVVLLCLRIRRPECVNFAFLVVQSILQEFLEKTKMDEKLKQLDDAVKNQQQTEQQDNRTNISSNSNSNLHNNKNNTHESSNEWTPEKFLADVMKKAKAEEIRRLSAIVEELQKENAALVDALKQKKELNIEKKRELLASLTNTEKVLQVTEEWIRSESKQWTENTIK